MLDELTYSVLFTILYILTFYTDFGFAQYLHSGEETKTLRGSPLYMVLYVGRWGLLRNILWCITTEILIITFLFDIVAKISHPSRASVTKKLDKWRNKYNVESMELVMKLKFNPLTPKISLINSPYLLPHSSCDVCVENLVLDELRIP